ncbi:uncharacterized protein CANTADRAFT_127951 [Suhomyces tanzawaensis NRRL Y-17324]|uniref:Uncharacterized protein n=1 Tax=Suhomyces tanzawaensis NRRL Y-17324 TaxID=984487 RepID=A0A1E4SQY6_9ASCO|nr:uncharacterized protein CANTADRAFT_127951 [Suhomyces tanzawaensis NRRL Y-17324]ODV81908.1 hypothetical protein CANTADRAFT_127951 [Suhomyces tanzawaensis NRRL Y-17324]
MPLTGPSNATPVLVPWCFFPPSSHYLSCRAGPTMPVISPLAAVAPLASLAIPPLFCSTLPGFVLRRDQKKIFRPRSRFSWILKLVALILSI